MEDKIIKCEITLNRIFYPKGRYKIESGEYAIFTATIINEIENCEELNTSWKKAEIKLKGNVCKLESEIVYRVSCRLADQHETYGDTYEILYISRKIDMSNKSKQIDFLEGIINPNTVYKLFEKYDNVIELLENKDIQALTSIKGIGNATAMRIIDEYEESKDYSHIYTELSNVNLSASLIKKLLDFYKSPDTVVDIVKNNPYKLIEVSGIGFKKADEIAQKSGMTGNDSRRVKACIKHVLLENGEAGKSYLHFSELMNIVFGQIGFIEQDIINDVAQQLMNKNIVKVSDDGQFIGLKRYYDLEMSICKHLIRLRDGKRKEPFQLDDLEVIIREVEEEQGYNFTDEQIKTIKMSVEHFVMAITGGGGTGKTTLLKAICRIFNKYSIGAVALSGKAAVRITEATGIPASTIHRLLGYKLGKFTHDESFPLDSDVLLVDESTMINGDLFLALLKSLKDGAVLIIVGDHQQLTPIGNCQVFTDILNCNSLAISKLTKLHRQAQASGIIPTSIKVISQEHIFKSTFEGGEILGELQDMELDIMKEAEDLSNKVVEHFVKHYRNSNNLIETQVVSPTKTRGSLSTFNLNIKIQNIINPVQEGDIFVEVEVDKEKIYNLKLGDKVINMKNNYKAINTDGETTAIFNGNMGIIKEIDNGRCVVDFVGIGEILLDREGVKKLELGYAATVHKMQGSGFDTVILAIDSSAFNLLNAELVYTGLTRAKKYCVLVGKNNSIRLAVSKREVKNKQTYLKEMLDNYDFLSKTQNSESALQATFRG